LHKFEPADVATPSPDAEERARFSRRQENRTMSDTPITDAVDAAYRSSHGLFESDVRTDDRSPKEIEAEQRKFAEERIERASKAQERKEFGRRIHEVRPALLDVNQAVNAIRNHKEFNETAVVESALRSLGPTADKEIVRQYVKTQASAAREGQLDLAMTDQAAELLVKAGWSPVSSKDPNRDDLSVDDIVAKVERY